MSAPPRGEDLSEQRQATAILRLALDPSGEIVHGELIDTATGPRGRFRDWSGLLDALGGWLASQGPPRS